MRIVCSGLLLKTKKHLQQLEDGFKKLGFGKPKVVGQYETLKGHGGDGGRSDVVLEVDNKYMGKMAVHSFHLSGGFRWADDYWNYNKDIVPENSHKLFDGYKE